MASNTSRHSPRAEVLTTDTEPLYSIFPPSWAPEMLAPKKRQAKAWTLVPHFARRTVSSASDASLRLTAQEDDEIRALAGLRAQLLVRDDQRRPRRRHLGDTKDLRRNHNAVECGFRVARLLRCRLALRASARPHTSVHHVAVRTPACQGDDAPSHPGLAIGPLRGRKDMRADRTFGLLDLDPDLQDRLKRAADIKVLSLAADKHRYRLESARKLARGLHCRDPSGLGGVGKTRRSREGIGVWLPPGIGCGQFRLQFFGSGCRLCPR